MKRGSSHLDMMVSFMMFSIFLLLLFVFLKPIDSKALPKELNTRLSWDFWKMNKVNLSEFYVKVQADNNNPCPSGGCYTVDIGGEIRKPLSNVLVEDAQGKSVDAKIASNQIEIKGSNNKVYHVLMSPDLEDKSISCQSTCNGGDVVAGVYEREVISYRKLEKMVSEYYNDYSSLKKKMGVPEVFDFAIVSKDIKGLDMQGDISPSAEVLAEEKIFEVLKPNGDIINARFVFKTW